MKNYRPAGVALAILFMLLFLGALGLRLWASGKSAETVGPDHIAVGQEQVYVHVNGELFILSSRGEMRQRRDIRPLVKDTSLIDLRVLRDGRLLLAHQRPAGIELCDPQGWRCAPLGRAVTANIRGQFKAVVDEATDTLYVSDFDSSRLWSGPKPDGEPQTVAGKEILRRPNDIAVDADGRLWVADSGHHRLVALAPKRDGGWEEAVSHDSRHRLARAGRDWPMMLALGPDGNWWVTQPTAYGGQGDLLLYHPEQGPRTRIALPEDAWPADLAALGDAMLVTDMDRFRIYRVDAATRAVGEFGDAAFRELMRATYARKTQYQSMVGYSLFGMIAAGVLMIAAAFWASPRERRWSAPATPPLAASGAPAPGLKETYWLRRNPKTEAMLRWMKPMSFVMPVLMIAAFGGIYYLFIGCADVSGMSAEQLARLDELEKMILVMVFFAVATPIVALAALRSLEHRLGTDGHRLCVRLSAGRQISLAPEQLVYSARQIAYQGYIFPIQTGKGQSLYETGEIETYIAPLLGRARKLSGWRMFRYQLEHREPTLMSGLVFAVMLTLMLWATGLWRQFLTGR